MASLGSLRLLRSSLQVGRSITRTITANRISSNTGEKYVETEEKDGVRTVKLNNPKTLNSLSLETLTTLLQSIAYDSENVSLRSIVIKAAPGKVFSAGHNLKELTTDAGENHHRMVFETCAQLMEAIVQCPVPVIAAVDGLAAAAGCQLVAACDIAVCTERSSFSTPGVNFGIFCSTPGIPLIRNLSRKKAAHMLFTGFPITATEAHEAGLVSKVVRDSDLDEEVKKITDAIQAKSRSVVCLGKKFIHEQMELDASTAYSLGTEIMINNLKMKDAQEGIRSFVEKRKPTWAHTYDKDKS